MASPSATGNVTVYVTGKVRKPGVLTLPSGSRVIDALTAAGGLKKDATPGNLNLARRLVDGEQIVAGLPNDPGSGPPPSTGGPLSLNSATAAQLEELPGVGEVLAGRIIDYRDSRGGFQSVEQLREISGIGERKFAELKDKVSP
ncbi:ComEA family DNA-binding protein [Acrocarpospora catenulata]|uniref:ComEA family DNA-binding protein n=1 Tax=Acrocarpospora catenulata TaxID=2836182 RepID=UPI001BDA2361|nr:ComEA family DNA-binding protein [Acrocarpospora catenulata]